MLTQRFPQFSVSRILLGVSLNATIILALALMFLILDPVPIQAQTAGPWTARHGLPPLDYQTEFNKMVGAGYRLIHVDGFARGESTAFNTIWVKKTGPDWQANHGLTAAQFQADFNKKVKAGYRLMHLDGYSEGGQAKYAAIWEKKGGTWRARHGMKSNQYQDEFNKNQREGYRLIQIEGFNVGRRVFFNAIWEKGRGSDQLARHGMNTSEYQTAFTNNFQAGYTIQIVDGYILDGQPRFVAVWENQVHHHFEAHHNLTATNFQHAFDNAQFTGARPRTISGYHTREGTKYAVIFENNNIRGNQHERIKKIVTDYIKRRQIEGLSLALAKDGRLIYARGFGFANIERGELVSPRHRFRIASVSKPITAAAATHLSERNSAVNLNSQIFGTDSLTGTRHINNPSSRLQKVQLRHLLSHTSGGWANNIMFGHTNLALSLLIQQTLASNPLGQEPGAQYNYSNFGYALVGNVIAIQSGMSYETYVQRHILGPCGIRDMTIAQNTTTQNMESRYYGNEAYTLNIRRMAAHGGWIARPRDLVRFALCVDGNQKVPDVISSTGVTAMRTGYVLNNETRSGYGYGWGIDNTGVSHNGDLAGTMAVLEDRNNGITWAIVVNRRIPSMTLNARITELTNLGRQAINGITNWPSHDLFDLH